MVTQESALLIEAHARGVIPENASQRVTIPDASPPPGLRLALVQPLTRRRGAARWRAAVQADCAVCGEPIGPGQLGNAVFLADRLRYQGAAAVDFVHKCPCDRKWRRAHQEEGRWGWLPLEQYLSDLGLRLVQQGGK